MKFVRKVTDAHAQMIMQKVVANGVVIVHLVNLKFCQNGITWNKEIEKASLEKLPVA
jgi:hypothetical protein